MSNFSVSLIAGIRFPDDITWAKLPEQLRSVLEPSVGDWWQHEEAEGVYSWAQWGDHDLGGDIELHCELRGNERCRVYLGRELANASEHGDDGGVIDVGVLEEVQEATERLGVEGTAELHFSTTWYTY